MIGSIVKWPSKRVFVALFTVATMASAQSATQDRELAQETQVRGYWTDPSTRLMWAGKDNGKDVNWLTATKYCHDLRLAGYSDWRLATIDELEGIYDSTANAPGPGLRSQAWMRPVEVRSPVRSWLRP